MTSLEGCVGPRVTSGGPAQLFKAGRVSDRQFPCGAVRLGTNWARSSCALRARAVHLRRPVEWERNARVSCRVVALGSGGHLLFDHGSGVVGIDWLSEPPTPAHGTVVGRHVVLLQVDVNDACLVFRLAAAAEDPHSR